MNNTPHLSVEYRYDHAADVVHREGHGTAPDAEFEPAACHATVTDIEDAIDECERGHARVRRVVIGTREYEHVLAYLAHQRGMIDPLRMGNPADERPDDIHALVEAEVGTDVVVVCGSMIHAVGGPLDELARYLTETDDDE